MNLLPLFDTCSSDFIFAFFLDDPLQFVGSNDLDTSGLTIFFQVLSIVGRTLIGYFCALRTDEKFK